MSAAIALWWRGQGWRERFYHLLWVPILDFLLASCVQGGSCPGGQGRAGFHHTWYMNRLHLYPGVGLGPKPGMAHEGLVPAARGRHITQVRPKEGCPALPSQQRSWVHVLLLGHQLRWAQKVFEELTPCSWQHCSLLSRHCSHSVRQLGEERVFQLCSWAGHRGFHAREQS